MAIMFGYVKRFLNILLIIIENLKKIGIKKNCFCLQRYMMPKSALLQHLHTEADSH